MKRKWALVGIMVCLALLAGCGSAGTYWPETENAVVTYFPTQIDTLNPTEMAFEVTRSVMNATATGAFLDLERERQRATNIIAEGTADAARFEATQAEQAREATGQAFVAGMTQEAVQATEHAIRATEGAVQATQVAQATVDGMALMVAQWTVTADAEIAGRQALAWSGTATADASNATATSVYLGMISTEQANVLRLAGERQEKVNGILAVAPYAVGVVGSALFLWLFVLLVRAGIPVARVIRRDARGDAPLILTELGSIVDMDRNAGPLLNPGAPQTVDQGMQERTTARDQAVDLAHRGLGWQAKGTQSTPRPAMPEAESVKARPQFMIFRSNQTPPVRSEILEVLDADWKESNDGNA